MAKIEVVTRIQCAISKELIRRTVEFIGSRPADCVHNGAVAAKLGRIGVRENLKFTYRFNPQRRTSRPRPGAVLPEVTNVCAI